jgi:integrase
MIDVNIKMPDGSWTRVRKVSPVPTKRGAARYEREIRQAVLARGLAKEQEEPKQVPKKENQPKRAATPAAKKSEAPTFASFAAFFLDTYATTNNRPSTVREKRRALGRGLLDELGRLRLDQITTRHVEAFKARRKRDGVGPKTINEEVAILGKILGYAEEIGELRQPPPKLRRLKVPRPKLDFLDFAEADRLVAAARHASKEWCAMIPTALWTGLRLGELRALRWEDLELDGARLHVRRAAHDGDGVGVAGGGGSGMPVSNTIRHWSPCLRQIVTKIPVLVTSPLSRPRMR